MSDKKSSTIIKKDKRVIVKAKNGQSYSFNYSTLAQIHQYLEDSGQGYMAFIDTLPGTTEEIMYIQKLDKDSNKLGEPIRGAKIFPGQNAQSYGANQTIARRQSLLLAYGLACEDEIPKTGNISHEEAESAKEQWKRIHTASANNPVSIKQRTMIKNLCEQLGKTSAEALAIASSLKNAAQASAVIDKLNNEMFERKKDED